MYALAIENQLQEEVTIELREIGAHAFECPDIERGAVFTYLRVSCGHFFTRSTVQPVRGDRKCRLSAMEADSRSAATESPRLTATDIPRSQVPSTLQSVEHWRSVRLAPRCRIAFAPRSQRVFSVPPCPTNNRENARSSHEQT